MSIKEKYSAAEQPSGLEGENELISMDRMKAIRDAIRVQDGMDGDDWDFALANAVTAHLARQSPAPGKSEEILALHRQLAGEKLRADQGWERAEAKSSECIELRERLAAPVAQEVEPGSAPAAADEVRDAAMKFADHIINGIFEGGDWDGDDVQELAVKYGLLKLEVMAEPCGEDGACQCAQNVPFFPAECYRKTYVAALKTTASASTSEQNGDAA